MPKRSLPTYSIATLKDAPASPKDFVADHFAHYLDEHQNLKFPHKHNFYHLVYFSKGTGQHAIDFKKFPVEKGQIYFMIPGQVHSWHFKSKPEGYIVNFSEEYVQALLADPRYLDQFSFFSGIADQQVVNIPISHRKDIEVLLDEIVKEGNSAYRLKEDMVRTQLVQLFISISRLIKHDDSVKTGYNSILLRNFQKLIDQHYKEKKLTKEYAELLYVTPNHLNALCKDITGRPAGELIRDRVLLEAKRLLINAKLSISEISLELGFADNSYFTKFFKKYEGVTPEMFRKSL